MGSVYDKDHMSERGFQDNLSGFNSLNRNVRMVACRQWGDSRVRANNVLKSTLLKLKYTEVGLYIIAL